MAQRLGLTLHKLRKLDPGACESDARIVMKAGDARNLAILNRGEIRNLSLSGTRELRLLARQMLAFADYIDGEYDFDTEVLA